MVERYEALCDLPIPLLYRKLDAAYPGSKFILTVRHPERWLDSLRRHFDADHNQWRQAWDNDPFTHRVHEILYGRKDFDASTFLSRYQRHNREVQEYFEDRPGDLLVMNVDRGDNYRELCSFLSRKLPGFPFPHENQSVLPGP